MSLSWRDAACGLPVPMVPLLPGWRTRLFVAVVIVADGDLARLRDVARRLRKGGAVVRLPDGGGAEWPCRLTAWPDEVATADGRWRVELQFEVVDALPDGG